MIKILENVSLKPYSTMRTGGYARYFAIAKSDTEMIDIIKLYSENYLHNKSILIIGGGSNILFPDDTYNGLVIKNEIKYIKKVQDTKETLGEYNYKDNENSIYKYVSQFVSLEVGAGVIWDELVAYTVDNEMYGLENLSYIPGTVGAAPIQNIGAYGVEVCEYIKEIKVYNIAKDKIEILNNAQCDFSYRDSLFKRNKNLIVLSVTFKLSKEKKFNLNYGSLKDLVEESNKNTCGDNSLDLLTIRNKVIELRKSKLPEISQIGNCGSFFKNPIIEKALYNKLLSRWPDMPHYSTSENNMVKVPAGWLIEHIYNETKKKKESTSNEISETQSVGLWPKQNLAIVNNGDATTNDILIFAKNIQDKIYKETNIFLELEVNVV